MKNFIFKCSLFILLQISSANIIFSQKTDTSINNYQNFTNIEEALKNPTEVYRLDLSNQQLNNILFDSLVKFKNLKFLSLRNDHLKEVPKSISNLKNLKVLDLSGNDFKTLPIELKKLKNLEEIYLNNDLNADIDQEVNVLKKLPNLKTLHLENDAIKSLPKSINSLKKLENLYLNDNNLKEFPTFLTNNKKLLFIDLKNNPMQWKGERPFGITINF